MQKIELRLAACKTSSFTSALLLKPSSKSIFPNLFIYYCFLVLIKVNSEETDVQREFNEQRKSKLQGLEQLMTENIKAAMILLNTGNITLLIMGNCTNQ